MIDAADESQAVVSKMEFFNLLIHNDLKDAAILIFANKTDLPTAKDAGEISNLYSLHEVKHHDWHI